MTNKQIARRYSEAAVNKDFSLIAELASPDIVVKYPQSGEVIRGRDTYLAMLSNYPGGVGDLEIAERHGGEERVSVQTPSFGMPLITITGDDSFFFSEGFAEYPDGGRFYTAGYIEIAGGHVVAETTYFAEPFDAPEWRKPYVEGSHTD